MQREMENTKIKEKELKMSFYQTEHCIYKNFKSPQKTIKINH